MVWTPFTCKDHNRPGLRYPSDLTDQEWALMKMYIPPAKPGGRSRTPNMRNLTDGIFHYLQSGCPWAMLPKDFAPPSTVHGALRRFTGDGTWARIHDCLYRKTTRTLEGREESPSYAIIDSQSVKTGADVREMAGFDAGKKVKGRKQHIIVDTAGLTLQRKMHGAGMQDRDGAALVFDGLPPGFRSSKRFAAMAAIRAHGYAIQVPRPVEIVKRNQTCFEVLPKRWIVERTFAWLGINRRLAKDSSASQPQPKHSTISQ